MRTTSFFRKLLVAGSYLFVFRKPTFIEFDFIDLLIDHKALFLVTWKQKAGYKVRIKQTHSCFYGPEGGVVVLLKSAVHEVDISFSNLWRKKSVTIPLKRMQFDEETEAYLLRQIRSVKNNGEVVWNTPLNQLQIHPILITLLQPSLFQRKIPLQPKVPRPSFNRKLILQTAKLNYQQ